MTSFSKHYFYLFLGPKTIMKAAWYSNIRSTEADRAICSFLKTLRWLCSHNLSISFPEYQAINFSCEYPATFYYHYLGLRKPRLQRSFLEVPLFRVLILIPEMAVSIIWKMNSKNTVYLVLHNLITTTLYTS